MWFASHMECNNNINANKQEQYIKMSYILEVQRFNLSGELNGHSEHIGYMNKVFKTKKDASNYYDMCNPHMRSLNAHNTWCSDWDPNSGLMYIVREHYYEHLTIPPFESKPRMNKMDDWGKIKINQIDSCHDFWCLINELRDDDSGFYENRPTLLDAYKNGNLYGLMVDETDSMYQRGARKDNIFCANSWYLLPCFCVKENNTAIIIWTHTRARKLGFAKKLVELLHIEHAYNPHPDSIGFWKKCNVKF